MHRMTNAVVLCVLAAAPCYADDVKPAPPKLAQLEEEFEVLDAQRDVKKARVKAAEGVVEGTKARYDMTARGLGVGTSHAEVLPLKNEYENAKAQLAIREAELKVVEVRLKYAKKRLDGAKASPRP